MLRAHASGGVVNQAEQNWLTASAHEVIAPPSGAFKPVGVSGLNRQGPLRVLLRVAIIVLLFS